VYRLFDLTPLIDFLRVDQADWHIGGFINIPRLIICVSMFGIYYLNWRRERVAFVFHTIAALGWTFYMWHIGELEATGSMMFSAATSIMGWVRWGQIQRQSSVS